MGEPVIERIAVHHKCDAFRSKHPKLQQFIRKFALANDQGDCGITHLALEPSDQSVVGYYTLSASMVMAAEFPEEGFHYRHLGVVLLGMLAVHKKCIRQRIGEKLLIHALRKAEEASQRCGAYAVVVDSLDTDEALGFYRKYGFHNLKRAPQDGQIPMFILMRKVREMLDAVRPIDSRQATAPDANGLIASPPQPQPQTPP